MHYQTSAAAGEKGCLQDQVSLIRAAGFFSALDPIHHLTAARLHSRSSPLPFEEDDALNSLQVFEIGHRPFTHRCCYLCTPALTFEAVKPV
jgi:hypothetical protein